MRATLLISVIALATASPLLAQSRNVDFGDAAGVPSDSFAGAGAPGPWEVWPGTGATDHPETTGDLERLLDDFESWSEATGRLTFQGLQNGVYRVITYVWNPDDENGFVVVWIDTSGIIDAKPIQYVYVGRTWPGGPEQGITHARLRANVLDGYLSIFYPLGGLQGIQLVLLDCDDASTGFDCNSNGVLDECEDDCNYNGIADECEVADRTVIDCNENGVPDECEQCYTGAFGPLDCTPPSLFLTSMATR